MQYVNGNDISSQSINEVLELSLSTRIPWKRLDSESSEKHLILQYSSNERGIYLSKGISEFNISPENMYELLLNISLRHKWDFHCRDTKTIEEYDHLNHIIHLNFTNPLIGNLDMNLYRSCKYDPQSRLFVIAMRSIELEDCDVDQFECLPNGWVIQGIRGERDKCIMTFVQQCHLRDIENQRIPGYKSFDSKETIQDFQFLTLFPATVSGRFAKIFESIEQYISTNDCARDIEYKDARISIMEKAEKEVNEMFGTTNPDYGWEIYSKKLDMQILTKKTASGYYMIGKGSFSSVFSPELLADVLYQEKPFEWETFYDKTRLVENINDNVREVEVNYRMWRSSISMRLLQSVKKGPGNFSSVHWRSISSQDYQVVDGIEVHYLPTALLNYGLGKGSFTSFLAAIEVKGYPTVWEEEMVKKLFAARIISNQNSIMNHVNRLFGTVYNTSKMMIKELPVIPSVAHHCGDVGSTIGTPANYNTMVENFANILLDESNKDLNIASSKNKRKRNGNNNDDENDNNDQVQNYQNNNQINNNQNNNNTQTQSQIPKQQPRPSIRITNMSSTSNNGASSSYESDEQRPIAWRESKKQPFLFLVSENSDRKGKIQRKTYYFSNSSFDNLPEEVVQIIFSNLSASNIMNLSLVCKRFKMATDSPILWKNLYTNNPLFHKLIPKRKSIINKVDQVNSEQIISSTAGNAGINEPQTNQTTTVVPPRPTFNLNDPISLLMTFTNGVIPPDLTANDIANITSLVAQVNFTDFSNIGEILVQLPPSIIALIPMETIHQKIQEMIGFIRLMGELPSTINNNNNSNSSNGYNDNNNGPNNNGGRSNKNNNYIPSDEFINWRSQYTEKYKQSKRWTNMKPTRITELKGHAKTIKCVKSEGNSAISVSSEKKIRFWNLNSGECIGTYEEPGTSVISIEYDKTQKSTCIWPISDYTKVHIGHKSGLVTMVDFLEQPIEKKTFTRTGLSLADGFDFNYPGKYFIWELSMVEFWDVETSTILWTEPQTHTKKITQAKVVVQNDLSNGGIVFTTSSDRTAKIWNLSNGQLISTLSGHTSAVNCIESIGDYMVLTGSSDKTLKLWDLRQTNTFLVNYPTNHTSPIRCLSYQEKNGIVMSGSDDNSIITFNLDNWSHQSLLHHPPTTIPAVVNTLPINTPVTNNTTTTTTTTTTTQINPIIQKITIGTFKESSRLMNHNAGITCIDSDEAGFVSGSSNGVLLRWDFQ